MKCRRTLIEIGWRRFVVYHAQIGERGTRLGHFFDENHQVLYFVVIYPERAQVDHERYVKVGLYVIFVEDERFESGKVDKELEIVGAGEVVLG